MKFIEKENSNFFFIFIILFVFVIIGAVFYKKNNATFSNKIYPKSNSGVLIVPKATKQISVNGILSEWDAINEIKFYANAVYANDPNFASIKLQWDDDKLYIAFLVKDKKLNALQVNNNNQVWKDDGIEVFISTSPTTAPDQNLTENEYQFNVNVNGSYYYRRGIKGNNLLPEYLVKYDTLFKVDLISSTYFEGTVNDNSDEDEFYIVEMAINWSTINYVPNVGDTLLADFLFQDNDESQKYKIGWAGLFGANQPSKWGIIALGDSNYKTPEFSKKTTGLSVKIKTIVIIVILLVVILLGIYWYRRQLLNPIEISDSDSKHRYKKIKITNNTKSTSVYIDSIYNDLLKILEVEYKEGISTKTIATRLNTSERNLSRIIKITSGKTFRVLLNEIRIEASIELMKTNNKLSLTEISMLSGFQTLDHYSKVFKRFYNQSPSSFRTRVIKK